MRNNENVHSQSPNQELTALRKKIESQHQQSHSHDQKIMELKTKLQTIKQRISEKRQKLAEVQQKVAAQKQKGSQIIASSSQQSSQQGSHPSSLANTNSEIINQLREHFKALRMQMGDLMGEDEDQYEDQVDVDNMTYEELLELGDKIGKVSKGLDTKKMKSLEVKKYHNSNPNEPFDCAICREQMEQGTECIELNCHHVFHEQCIKGWLNVEKQCPNCKREINI